MRFSLFIFAFYTFLAVFGGLWNAAYQAASFQANISVSNVNITALNMTQTNLGTSDYVFSTIDMFARMITFSVDFVQTSSINLILNFIIFSPLAAAIIYEVANLIRGRQGA